MSNHFDNQSRLRDTAGEDAMNTNGMPSAWRERLKSLQRNGTMSEGKNKGASGSSPAAAGTVEALAAQVLSLVATKADVSPGGVRDDLLQALVDAVLAFDPAQRRAALTAFSRAGISKETIVDHYIPAAARLLGDDWCSDGLSFADVTIGSARLQGLTRELRSDDTHALNAPTILIIVPRDAYHTLGATVVADQLRRKYLGVKLAMGYSDADLEDLLRTHEFDAVMISAAACERLETVRKLVNSVKMFACGTPPVIVGGTVTNQETELRSITGADYISNNPEEALEACGLTIQTPDAVSPEVRG